LRDIRNRIQNSLEPNPRALIEHQIQNLFDAVGGEDGLGGAIPADRIQNVHTALDEMTATGIAPFKRDLRNALNRAIERAATPEDRALLARNDREYSAMKQIAAAMRGSDDFMVRPGRLFTATRVARRELQSIYGVGPNAELAEYARAGRLILGNKTPQSGTPRRAAALGSFSALGTGLAGAFGFAGYEAQERTGRHGGIPPWVVGVASAAFGPAMVRKAIESPALAARISQWARSQGITDAASATRYLATIGGGAAGVQMAEPGIGQQRPAINLTDMD
jgi:hypothetical protein